MKSFKQFVKDNKMRVYLDMDGVLADFDAECKKIHGKSARVVGDQIVVDVEKGNRNDFFPNLKVIPEGRKLFNFVSSRTVPWVLSSCGGAISAIEQKKDWIRKHFPSIPEDNIIIVLKAKDKSEYANENSILIDDHQSNIKRFNDAGGIGLYFTGSSSTIIKHLKGYI